MLTLEDRVEAVNDFLHKVNQRASDMLATGSLLNHRVVAEALILEAEALRDEYIASIERGDE